MSAALSVQHERLVPLPGRHEMATLNIGNLNVIGFAPGGTAVVSVNIIDIQAQSANLFFCFTGC
jgi:hypothetical protein